MKPIQGFQARRERGRSATPGLSATGPQVPELAPLPVLLRPPEQGDRRSAAVHETEGGGDTAS